MGDETTRWSDLRGSSLSVLETIAPSETVPAPITEDDDPHVRHWGWWDGMGEKTGRKPGNPIRTLCGKLVYELPRANSKRCRACTDIAKKWR